MSVILHDEPKSGSKKKLSGPPAFRLIRTQWRRIARWVARRMPKRLFPRSLIIVVAPMLLLQSVVLFLFMERHYEIVTLRLSQAVARDIAAIVALVDVAEDHQNRQRARRIALQNLSLKVDFLPDGELPVPGPRPFFNLLDQTLTEQLDNHLVHPFWIDTVGDSKIVEVRVKLNNEILRFFAPRNHAYASNSHIFVVWMLATSLVLLTIAVLFLRNQIRPIQMLAQAAESFGKGQPIPEEFHPWGADEVRRAGVAFDEMRKRIERQIDQRTMMLSGVSHDLRTILTRFKLHLAFVKDKQDHDALHEDVAEMQAMLEGYLNFARGESGEEVAQIDLTEVYQTLQERCERAGKTVKVGHNGPEHVRLRPNAFKRLMLNLVENAMRYAGSINLASTHNDHWLTIVVDDDGPGIPPDRYSDVFKPFFRLDKARNQDTAGTGLGLAISLDIVRSHGGDISLASSPEGGLRVVVKVPV